MAEDNEIKVKVSADTEEFDTALEELVEQVETASEALDESFTEIEEKIKEHMEAAAEAAKEAADKISEALQQVSESMEDKTKEGGEQAESSFKSLTATLGGEIKSHLGAIAGDVGKHLGAMAQEASRHFGAIAAEVGPHLGALGRVVQDQFVSIAGNVQGVLRGMVQGVGTIFGSLPDGSMISLGRLATAVGAKIQNITTSIMGKFGSMKDGVKKTFDDFAGAVGTFTDKVTETIGKKLGGIAGKIATPFSAIKNAVQAHFPPIVSSVSSHLGDLANSFNRHFGGITSSVKTHLNGMSNAFKSYLSGMASLAAQKANKITEELERIDKIVETVSGFLGKFDKVVAAGKFLKERADESAKMTAEATKLGNALGISATEASVLNNVLKQSGSSGDEFTEMATSLAEKATADSASLEKLGLSLKGSNGEFLNGKDLMLEAFRVLNDCTDSTQRLAKAHELFGDQASKALELLDLNNQTLATAKERQEALGLTIGVDNVKDAEEYQKAMKGSSQVIDALGKTIGDTVMPVITRLGEWFSDIGPAAVVVTRGAIGGLTAAFWGLKNGVVVVWETLYALAVSIADPLFATASAIVKVLHGDFAGALAEFKGSAERVSSTWSNALDKMSKSSEEARDKMAQPFLPSNTPVLAPAEQKKPADKKTDKKDESHGDKSQARKKKPASGDSDEIVDKRRNSQQIVQIQQQTAAQCFAITKEEVEQEKVCRADQVSENKQMSSEDVENWREASNKRIDSDIEEAKKRLEKGEITRERFLEIEVEFEKRRNEINKVAAEGRLALAAKEQDLAAYKKFLDKKLELEQQYLKGQKEIEDKARGKGKGDGKSDGKSDSKSGSKKDSIFGDLNEDVKRLSDTMQKSLGKAIDGMLKRTMTFKQALKSVFTDLKTEFSKIMSEIGTRFSNMLAKQITEFAQMVGHQVKVWLFGEEAKTEATETGAAIRKAAEEAASKEGMLSQVGKIIQSIMNLGAETFAGVWASLSKIPYVGPMLAAGAAPAAMATVVGMTASVASAAGGFDIPAGLNPMTQLHENEMVLPAKHADVIRRLADGGGGGAGGNPVNVHITAMDARSVRDYFRANSDKLAPALRKMARNFTPTKA